MDKVLLIDSHNFIYRGFISFGNKPDPNDTEDQKFTKAVNVLVYNFFRNLRPIVEMFSPNKVFFVREGYPQFRYDLYPEYKENRIIKTGSDKKQDSSNKFHTAKNIIFDLIKYLPITVARSSDYECDDTISSLCNNMKNEELTIVSNDTDYIQLLQRDFSNLKIYNSHKKVYFEKPDYHYIAYKSLRGDTSDNIEGIFTGKKDISTVETLASNSDALNKLLENKTINEKFQRNVKLITFADVADEEIELIDGESNFDQLKLEFEKLDFNSFFKDPYWENFKNTFNCIDL